MTQKIQYFHDRICSQDFNQYECYGGKTFCIEAPKTKDLIKYLNEYALDTSSKISIPFGMCKCHEQDRYVRKEGNRLALERITPTLFELKTASIGKDSIFFNFFNNNCSIKIKAFLPDTDSYSRLTLVFIKNKLDENCY